MKSRCFATLAVILAASVATPVSAQQAFSAGEFSQQGRGAARQWAANIQGFNIVLLVGEMQGPSGPVDDLPQGARRALTDMREFLPFKHYRVLDSQWTSCCPEASLATLAGRLHGAAAVGSGSEMKLVPRPHQFSLTIQPGGDRLQVQFSLREEEGGSRIEQAVAEQKLQRLVEDFQTARERLEEMKKRVAVGVAATSEVRALEDQVRQIERQIALTRADVTGQSSTKGSRQVIDSGFTMDVGETVVVGTSRLGGDKALIALVTAARRSGAARE